MEDGGILANIKRVAGSSAGAICAGLIAVGFTPQDIADVFKGDIKWLFQGEQLVPISYIARASMAPLYITLTL